jgi:UDP-N-acetylenolpyruvoylglucosamine reductase
MKRIVVSDKSGRIIATGPHPEDIPGLPGKFGFAALKNQQVHEVEMPDHVKTVEHLQELHKTYVVKAEGKTARLVKK